MTIETTQGLERQVKLSVDAKTVKEAITNELKKISKNARIDGFRKGKIPPAILEKHYGAMARQEVLGELLQRTFYAKMMQEKVNLAGRPNFTVETFDNDKGLEFTAKFEVFPEVKLQGLENITVEKPVINIGDEDVNKMLDVLRKQQATWIESKDPASNDNRVMIDFVGSVDGEEFKGGKASDFSLTMGQGSMIPGFEEGIVGHKAGDEFNINVTFPTDYHAENLKGKDAVFAIKLKKVEAMQLPELTDEFVAKFGPNTKTVADLKAEVLKNMQREAKNVINSRIKNTVLEELLKTNPIEIPSSAIAMEVDNLRHQAIQRFNLKNDQAKQLPAELFESEAKRRVQMGLLLGTAIAELKIKTDEKRVMAMLEEMSSAYETPEEVIKYYQGNAELMNNLRNAALEEQTIEALLEKGKVTEKNITFEQLMNQQTQT